MASEPKFKRITKNGIKFGEIKCTFVINRTKDFKLYPDPDAAFSGGMFLTPRNLITPLRACIFNFFAQSQRIGLKFCLLVPTTSGFWDFSGLH